MKKWLLYIMLVGVLGMHTTSCVIDDDLAPYCPQEGKTQVVFTLTLNNNNGSRATNPNWGEEEYDSEDGEGVDNLINNLQVLFFGATDSKYIGNVQNAIFYEQSAGVYEFIGEISIDAAYVTTNDDGSLKLNAKMMVLANCADITLGENGTYEDVQALAYDGATSPSQIPMWGIQSINTPITVGERNELDDIELLRAMAKVEVIMAAEGYTMENIILNRYNAKGYCAPGLGESEWSDVDATADLATEGCVNYNPTVLGEELSVAATNNKVVFYIPECENSTETPLNMYVNIMKGTTDVDENLTDANLYFKDYSDNVPFNIVRNHIYRYTITGINSGEDLDLTLEVQNWDVFSEEIEFTEDVTISNSGRMTYAENVNVKENTDDASILYINGCIDAETALEFNFKIDTPSGATWYASFEGDKDAFAFIDEDENRLIDANGNSSVTGNVGEEATLRIITTEANVSEMKSVTLRMVVITMDRRTIVVNDKLMPDELNESSYYTIRQNLEVAN